jgi:hypothetical protein
MNLSLHVCSVKDNSKLPIITAPIITASVIMAPLIVAPIIITAPVATTIAVRRPTKRGPSGGAAAKVGRGDEQTSVEVDVGEKCLGHIKRINLICHISE